MEKEVFQELTIKLIQIIKKGLIRFFERKKTNSKISKNRECCRNAPFLNMNKNYIKNAVEQIKIEEGFRNTPYICTNGYLTVGYGKRVDYIDLDEKTAENWLFEDSKELDKRIEDSFNWYADSPDSVKEVVLDMCYQMGISGFRKFKKTIYYLETEQYFEASEEMMDSKWARKDSPNRALRNSKKIKLQGEQ